MSVILFCVFKANVIYNFVACISSLLKQGIQYLMLFPSLVGLCQMLFLSLVRLCQMLFPSLVGLCQVVFQELVQNIPEKFQLFFIVILSLFHIIYTIIIVIIITTIVILVYHQEIDHCS